MGEDLHPGGGELVTVLEKCLLRLEGVLYLEARAIWEAEVGRGKDRSGAGRRRDQVLLTLSH